MSTKYVIGNHKLNPATLQDALTLAKSLSPSSCTVGIAPSVVYLSAIKSVLSNGIHLGVQDISHKTAKTGAFTGDVSVCQVADVGASFTLVGHSERRQYYGETDEVLSQKIAHALACGLAVIYCIGESKDEYERGVTFDVLKSQLQLIKSFVDVDNSGDFAKLIIAYEPVWAIGTGLTPTFDEIEKTHRFIKDELTAFGMTAPILYGGSVNDKNASELATSNMIDGALVGGASLKTDSFSAIISAFS